MVKSYFDKHINQLIRNLENKTNTSTGFKVLPDSIPSVSRDRVADTRFLVLPIIADTHCANSTADETSRDGKSTRSKDARASFDHIDNIVEFAKRFNVDGIIHTGDIVDGKATVANTTADLKKAVGALRAAKDMNNAVVPVALAKGNHDNNALFGRAQAGTAKDDMKYTIKGGILDTMLRAGASAQVVFDQPYASETAFSSKFEGFMNEEEYRVMSKLLLEDGRMSARNTSKTGNLDVLDTVLTSTTLTKAEKDLFTKFAALATAKRSLKADESGITVTERATVRNVLFRAIKNRLRGSYCYIDFANKGSKGIRVIVLDAYDVPDTTMFEVSRSATEKLPNKSAFPVPDFGAFGKRQVQWFANVALKTTKDVVIFAHHALPGTPFTTDGGSKTYSQTSDGDSYWFGNNELMKAIIDDFILGSSNTYSTYDAIKRSSEGVNKVSLVKPSLDPGKTKTPLFFYNQKENGSSSKKYNISNAPWVKTEVTTDFRLQGAGRIITICNGHSHSDLMARDVTGKYISIRTNSSFRAGGGFNTGIGFDSVTFSNGVVKNNTLARLPGTYAEDHWQVMVIDTQESKVYMHQFGAGMHQENLAQHVSTPDLYKTAEQKKELIKTAPNQLDPRYTGIHQIRRFPYGVKLQELGVIGLQEKGDIE